MTFSLNERLIPVVVGGFRNLETSIWLGILQRKTKPEREKYYLGQPRLEQYVGI
jgi:hypothetical protein